MKIRKMKQSDLKQSAKFLADAYTLPPYNQKRRDDMAISYIKDKFSKGKNTSYVLEDKGKVLGFAICSMSFWADGKQAMLEEIVIDPKYQRQGLGKKLTTYVFRELKKIKTKSVSLWVKKKSPAYKFHTKNGFTEEGGFVVMFKNL
ncbi:MAG TPA: GNAT family N-acetyltransferase [Candidatus Magasanikbacteria bacterium]|nr:GNAT family N-acetyltransferase [Candidatus Magasanikbacteria bacterium]